RLYRPLVVSTYAVNYALGGLNPFGYHLVNVILHLAVTWVLYVVAIEVGFSRVAALMGAAVFAVHPIHTEAVTGVVGRAEVLMSLGVLGGLWAAIHGRALLSLVAFGVGLFSKEQAAVLPFLILLYDVCRRKRLVEGRRRGDRLKFFEAAIVRYGGYFLVLGGYLVMRGIALQGFRLPPVGFIENPLAYAEGYSRVLTALKVAGKYLWLFIWPASLSADYSYNSIPIAGSILEPGVFLALVGWGGLLCLAFYSFFRGERRAAFCVGFTAVTFLPVANLIVPIGTIMGERLFYLPSAGLCLLAGLTQDYLPRSATAKSRLRERGARSGGKAGVGFLSTAMRPVGIAILALVCVSFTVRTFLRNRDWANDETLFQKDIQAFPENAKLNFFMGSGAMDKQQWERALSFFQTASAINPRYSQSDALFSNRYGKLLLEVGRTHEAIDALEQATGIAPTWSVPQFNLGLAYAKQRRYQEAEAALRRAVSLNSQAADVYSSLSRLLIEMSRFEEAVSAAEEALRRDPEFLWAHFNRAWALEKLGRFPEAAAGYETVLSLGRNLDLGEIQQRLLKLRER
ncbi:MAG: tetratricopeptide repeat protein, partial [Deltaproteobacteria bacterium]|nr:tetratricopeptide repeat protein [Deltaproteobacteria bacterium]